MGTVEKLTLENMGVAFGILSLGSTETEIYLGAHLPPPPIATYVLKNTIATLGLRRHSVCWIRCSMGGQCSCLNDGVQATWSNGPITPKPTTSRAAALSTIVSIVNKKLCYCRGTAR